MTGISYEPQTSPGAGPYAVAYAPRRHDGMLPQGSIAQL
jgi:hypothetical protein